MSRWKDISTAPKDGTANKHDGTAVLLANSATGVRYVGRWFYYTEDAGEPYNWAGWVCSFTGEDMPEPTHWMPLPEPPVK